MKKLFFSAFVVLSLFSFNSDSKQSQNLTSENQEINSANKKPSQTKSIPDPVGTAVAGSKSPAGTQKKEQKKVAEDRTQKTVRSSNNRTENYQLEYSSNNSIELSGIYKCSKEDMIRLNSNGTGRMIISYLFDGVRSFSWKYNSEEEELSIRSEPPEDMKYEMPPIYLTLNLKRVNGRIAFEHYTSGPTFLYIKQ
jgi:hypothetical protein